MEQSEFGRRSQARISTLAKSTRNIAVKRNALGQNLICLYLATVECLGASLRASHWESGESLCWEGMGAQPLLCQQLQNTSPDLIAGLTNCLDPLSLGVGQRPIITSETRNVGAFISAAHCDQQFGLLGQFCCELLRPGVAEIDSDLTHHRHNDRMNMLRWLGSGRDATRQFWVGKLVEECSRHLRTSCIVNAGKDKGTHLWSNSFVKRDLLMPDLINFLLYGELAESRER